MEVIKAVVRSMAVMGFLVFLSIPSTIEGLI